MLGWNTTSGWVGFYGMTGLPKSVHGLWRVFSLTRNTEPDLNRSRSTTICTKLIRFTDSRSNYYINAGLTICKIQSQSRRKNIPSTVKMLPIFFSPLTHNAVRPGSVRPPVLKVQGPFALILYTCMYYIGMLCTGACFIIFFNTTNNISGMGKNIKQAPVILWSIMNIGHV